jgi:hydroxyethylthiazole kinase-like uncharacterized protein yjeF
MKVCKVSEIRDLDKRATEEFGIPEEILMENAGEATYSVILKEFGIRGKKFTIFCGPGNNGGDGFVVARKLHSSGGQVKVLLLGGKEKYGESAKNNLKRIERLPIESKELKSAEEAQDGIKSSDAIVDGIFGVGLFRNLEGIYRDVIQLINDGKKKVFAIDIPSGINSDTAEEMGISVRADYTITFGLPKIGSLLYPGYGRSGKLYVSHISYPLSIQELD